MGRAYSDLAASLNEHGIVVLPPSFETASISSMQRECDSLMLAKTADDHDHVQYGGATDEEYLSGAPALSSALVKPIVWALGAHVWGRDPRLSYCRLYRIEPTAPKHYRAFQPHDDGHDKELKVMLLLSDVASTGQCMLYWRGTHRIARRIVSSRDTIISPSIVASLGEPVRCCGRAGTMFVFNTKGIHSGQRNRSPRRDALVFNITGGKRIYPVPVLAETVRRALDPYTRSVLRVGREKCLDEIEGRLPKPLPAADRRAFLREFAAEIEREAQLAADHTRASFRRAPATHTLPKRLPTRPRPRATAHCFRRPSHLAPNVAAQLRRALPATLASDVIRGIDLPLQPYSGTRDRLRDIALCQVRDVHMTPATITRLVSRIPLASANPFPRAATEYMTRGREAHELFATASAQQGETFLANSELLAVDLLECLRTAETVPLLRTPLALLAGTLDSALARLPAGELADRATGILDRILLAYAFFVHVQHSGAMPDTADLADVLALSG